MLETDRHAEREERSKRQPNDQTESRPAGRKRFAGSIEPPSGPDSQRNGQHHREPERNRNPSEAIAQKRTRQDHATVVEIDVGRPDPASETAEGVGDHGWKANRSDAVAE